MRQTLIDVREPAEFAAAHIPGSQLVPLGTLATTSATWDRATPITLICRSGQRATQARQILSAEGFHSPTVLDGGINAWAAAGKPLLRSAAPWSLERQVRIGAGSLVLLTLAFAHFVSAWFFLSTAFIGAGLIFAGITDICMMGNLLARMPWNRTLGRS